MTPARLAIRAASRVIRGKARMLTWTRVFNALLASSRTHLGLMVNASPALMGPSLTVTRPIAQSATSLSPLIHTNQQMESCARAAVQENLRASQPWRRQRTSQMKRQKGQTLAVTARPTTTRRNYLELFLAITIEVRIDTRI